MCGGGMRHPYGGQWGGGCSKVARRGKFAPYTGNWRWGRVALGRLQGVHAYNIGEMVNANPWDEGLSTETLPVFKNAMARKPDVEAMKKRLVDIAGLLGMEADNMTVTDDSSNEKNHGKQASKIISIILQYHRKIYEKRSGKA